MENDLSCDSNDQWYLFFVFTFRSVQLTYKWTFTLFSWNVQWYLQPFGQAGWWVYTLTVKEMSLKHQNRPSEQSFLTNIFKSKPHPSVASGHAQMTHFELWSNVAGQFFWYFKTTLVSQAREARDIIDKILKLPKTYAFFSKKVNRRRHFQILMTWSKIWELVCKLHTSHVKQLMTFLFAITSQVVSLVLISSQADTISRS